MDEVNGTTHGALENPKKLKIAEEVPDDIKCPCFNKHTSFPFCIQSDMDNVTWKTNNLIATVSTGAKVEKIKVKILLWPNNIPGHKLARLVFISHE